MRNPYKVLNEATDGDDVFAFLLLCALVLVTVLAVMGTLALLVTWFGWWSGIVAVVVAWVAGYRRVTRSARADS